MDRPVSGKRLVLDRSASGGRLVFVSKDPALLFPQNGSVDDPNSGIPGGAVVELLSPVEPIASLEAPRGPGWRISGQTASAYVFKNPEAPDGVSVVRKILLKRGKVLRVVSADPGLQLSASPDRIAIRVTMGSLRNCAVFTGDAVRENVAGKFVADAVPVPAIADCSDASLLGIPTTTTTSVSTTTTTSTTLPCDCFGTCEPEEECVRLGSGSGFRGCGCIPIGATPCGSPGAPACGGECPTSRFCSAYVDDGTIECRCAFAGTQCPNGTAWHQALGFSNPAGCAPIFCYDQDATCGGGAPPCGDGGICYPFRVEDAFPGGCLCATPAPCDDASSGWACAAGEVCVITGPTTRECAPS
jgi:hypothetical protein